VQAVVSVSGAPVTPSPRPRAASRSSAIIHARRRGVDIAKAKQNERYAVVLKITEAQPQFGRIIVADYLPAGFEIDNPRLVSSGDTGTLGWIAAGQDTGACRVPRRPLHRGLQAQRQGRR
jgi:alpha-2-macroglobulin